MRLFLTTMIGIFAIIAMPATASAADPDGAYQYCQDNINKRGDFNCDCVLEKYYPKKAELEQAWGVPINDPAVAMMHVTAACTNTEKSGNDEYNTCIQSPTFKTSKNEFGAERFCKCYAQEWEKQLSEYIKTPNSGIDRNTRKHFKGLARATCKRKFR